MNFWANAAIKLTVCQVLQNPTFYLKTQLSLSATNIAYVFLRWQTHQHSFKGDVSSSTSGDACCLAAFRGRETLLRLSESLVHPCC